MTIGKLSRNANVAAYNLCNYVTFGSR